MTSGSRQEDVAGLSRRDVDAIADQLASARYDQVARSLEDAGRRNGHVDRTARWALTLIDRCRRVAADRTRLQEVLDDLIEDEAATRQELLGLLGQPDPDTGRDPDPRHHADPGPGQDPDPRLHADHADPDPRPHPDPGAAPAAAQASATERQPVAAEPGAGGGGGPVGPGPRVAVWLLGPFRLVIDGQLIPVGSDRAGTILRFLALLDRGGIHKEQLADTFWPASDGRTALRNLHQAVYTVRRLLARYGAESELVFQHDHYVLRPEGRWRDIDELTEQVVAGRAARSAGDTAAAVAAYRRADLAYRGELLADQPYDDWVLAAREHHRMVHREAVAALIDHHWETDDPCGVLQLANRLLTLDPCDEDAARQLIRAHRVLGQPHLAAMTFELLVDNLGANGGHPSAETMALVGSVRV